MPPVNAIHQYMWLRRTGLLLTLAGSLTLLGGCRQIPRQPESPTPIPHTNFSAPEWDGPRLTPPPAGGMGAPPMPPADDGELPPLPGVSATPGNGQRFEESRPWSAVNPAPALKFTEFEQPSHRVLPVATDRAENTHEMPALTLIEQSPLPANSGSEPDVAPGQPQLSRPVALSVTTSVPSSGWTQAKSNQYQRTSTVDHAPQASASLPDWSTSGAHFDMVIAPGARSPQWSTATAPSSMPTPAAPQRLAIDDSDWGMRRIQ